MNLGWCVVLCTQELNHSLHLYNPDGHLTFTSNLIILVFAHAQLWHTLLALAKVFPTPQHVVQSARICIVLLDLWNIPPITDVD
jgi:hypothetical protein